MVIPKDFQDIQRLHYFMTYDNEFDVIGVEQLEHTNMVVYDLMQL